VALAAELAGRGQAGGAGADDGDAEGAPHGGTIGSSRKSCCSAGGGWCGNRCTRNSHRKWTASLC
jgi:hypothetical protein